MATNDCKYFREERGQCSGSDCEPEILESEEDGFCIDGLGDKCNQEQESLAKEELASLLQLCDDACGVSLVKPAVAVQDIALLL